MTAEAFEVVDEGEAGKQGRLGPVLIILELDTSTWLMRDIGSGLCRRAVRDE